MIISRRTILLVVLIINSGLSLAQTDTLLLRKRTNEIMASAYDEPKKGLKMLLELEPEARRSTSPAAVSFYKRFVSFLRIEGLYDEALKYAFDYVALTGTDELNYWIAMCYQDLKKYELAEKYYNLSKDNTDTHSALSDMYLELNKPEESLRESAKMLLKLPPNDSINLSVYVVNMGIAYRELGDFDLSQTYLLKGLNIDKRIHYIDGIAEDLFEVGSLFKEKKNYITAYKYYDSALVACKQIDGYEQLFLLDIYKELYLVCEILGDYKNGFQNSLKYTALRDSIFNQERLANVATLDLKIALQEQQREEAKDLQRTRLIQDSGVLIALIILVAGLFYLKRFNLNPKVLGSTLFVILLLLFEFILVVLDPFIQPLTGNTPLFILLANFVIALLFVPVHRFIEQWFSDRVLVKASALANKAE